MANKGLFGGMAAILLVAAIVGVVATVTTRSHNKQTNDSMLSSTSKAVSPVCSSTVHQDVCEQTLGKAINGSNFEPQAVIQLAVNVTIDHVRVAFSNLSITSNDPNTQNAINVCKKFVGFAMDDLYAVLKTSHSLNDLKNRADDIRVWLNGVISYQSACMEEIDNTEVKDKVNEIVTGIVQFASNAISIFEKYGSITKALGLDNLNITLGQGRRLLNAPTEDGFPSWFTDSDRRMLAGNARELRGARAAGPPPPTPNAIVAKDGSGQFTTINQALAAMPAKYPGRYVIYVKAGVYNENVLVDKNKPNVYMYGDGSRKTIVTAKKSFPIGTSQTATFAVEALGFIAKNMGFTNTAGWENHQAVALRVTGDMAAFFNVRLDGFQDTLYVQSNRQFYRNCVISGTIDFIFGNSYCVIQNSRIILRKPGPNQQNTVTAHGRLDPKMSTVLVIQNCRIVPDQALFPDRLTVKSYLGRPWKNYANTVIMESEIGDVIDPAGYLEWPGNNMNTVFYGEYANRGPGSVTTGRVRWPGVRLLGGPEEANLYTVDTVLKGRTWLQYTGERFVTGLNKH